MKNKMGRDDLRPEYDLSQLQGCVRGKFAAQLRDGSNIVLLDQDVAEVFRDDRSVNEALRTLMRLRYDKQQAV